MGCLSTHACVGSVSVALWRRIKTMLLAKEVMTCRRRSDQASLLGGHSVRAHQVSLCQRVGRTGHFTHPRYIPLKVHISLCQFLVNRSFLGSLMANIKFGSFLLPIH